jgi:hypothetical protein
MKRGFEQKVRKVAKEAKRSRFYDVLALREFLSLDLLSYFFAPNFLPNLLQRISL